MNKAKISRASKTFWQLQKAQERFNEAVNALSDEELAAWCQDNEVTVKSKSERRNHEVQTSISQESTVNQKETKGEKTNE